MTQGRWVVAGSWWKRGRKMIFTKVLVPVDGSESSVNALKLAKRLVGDDPGSTLYVISVVAAGTLATELEHPTRHQENNPMLFGNSTTYQKLIDDTFDEMKNRVTDAVGNELDDVACSVVIGAAFGSKVSDGIVDFAKSNDCDLIVMGRRGVSKLRGMLGSVTYGVLHEADIPVMSVK